MAASLFRTAVTTGARNCLSEAFGDGGYFEATMSFPATANTGGGAFWMNDFENMVEGNPGSNWVEVDTAEFDNTNNTTAQDFIKSNTTTG